MAYHPRDASRTIGRTWRTTTALFVGCWAGVDSRKLRVPRISYTARIHHLHSRVSTPSSSNLRAFVIDPPLGLPWELSFLSTIVLHCTRLSDIHPPLKIPSSMSETRPSTLPNVDPSSLQSPASRRQSQPAHRAVGCSPSHRAFVL